MSANLLAEARDLLNEVMREQPIDIAMRRHIFNHLQKPVPTPPVSTSAEKCASLCRELFPELCTGLSDDQSEFMRKLAIIQRHFNGQGEDSAK